MSKETKVKVDNMEIWKQVCNTNPENTKHVNARGGFTAIGAQTQVKQATQVFGPIGIGWGIEEERITVPSEGYFIYQALLWYRWNDKPYRFAINSSIVYKQQDRHDDDAVKKVATDALTKGLSRLGFNSDVFEGLFDDNKYVAEMNAKFGNKKKDTTKPKKSTNDFL